MSLSERHMGLKINGGSGILRMSLIMTLILLREAESHIAKQRAAVSKLPSEEGLVFHSRALGKMCYERKGEKTMFGFIGP